MAKSTPFYQRLTRARSGIGTYSSLWLGPDHLLLVTSSGYSESYQRFYFRDIQCLVAADSIRFAVLNAVFGCLLLFSGIPTIIYLARNGSFSPWAIVLMVPVLFLLFWNLFLGRTCNVTLMSGVQSVRLPPLSRFRRTRKVFARLVPLIEAAQAALTPPTLPPQPTPAASAAPARAAMPAVPVAEPVGAASLSDSDQSARSSPSEPQGLPAPAAPAAPPLPPAAPAAQ
jgi:hypothetical protein